MEIVNNQKALYSFLLCSGYGWLCGLIFTLVSLLFCRALRRPIVRAVADISLYFWAALGLYLLSLALTDGRPRLFLFVGTAVGALAWKSFFLSPFCRVWHHLTYLFHLLMSTIGRTLSPLRLWIQKMSKKSEFFFKNLLKFCGFLLYNKPK